MMHFRAQSNPLHGKYEGEIREGKKWGRGKEVWKNGQAYEGGFVDGLRNGFGILEFDDRNAFDLYIGQFQDDLFWGFGTLTWKSGDIYRGQFENGTINGIGDLSFGGIGSASDKKLKNATRYIGHFRNGKMHGFGILTFNAESPAKKFQGFFADDSILFKGTLLMKNGDEINNDEMIEQKLP